MNKNSKTATGIGKFVRLDIHCMNIKCYKLIFGYNREKIMNLFNQWLFSYLFTQLYDIQVCFDNILSILQPTILKNQ